MIKSTKNLLYYVEHNLASFKKTKFNELDAMVFSYISYFHIQNQMYKKGIFDSIALKDLNNRKYYNKMYYDTIDIEASKKLLELVSANPRYHDVEILYYIEESSKTIEKQFSAMTFRFLDDSYFVAYRGTDHSFVGWKEDLNMAFLTHVPAQKAALKYLKKVLDRCKGTFYIGGHSKGGNLAIYASSFIDAKYKKRRKVVYNFDGPGLNKKLISQKGYEQIESITKKYVTQSSIVGMCFERTHKYIIIKSNSIGILQHNPFTWEIEGKKFKRAKDSTFDSIAFKRAINTLIDSLSEMEIKTVVDSFYEIVLSTKVNTVEQFLSDFLNGAKNIIESIAKLSEEQKKTIMKAVSIYIKGVINSI